MTSDISIQWDITQAAGDWVIAGTDLLTGSDLQTAILISLFTDAMAATDDTIPDESGDPRGWWGDEFDPTHPTGSKLWLLQREKQTSEVLNKAYDYAAEALQWLIDDGVVGSFGIQASWARTGLLSIQITAYAPSGSVLNSGQYLWAWQGIN